jgi:hypothetical protein
MTEFNSARPLLAIAARTLQRFVGFQRDESAVNVTGGRGSAATDRLARLWPHAVVFLVCVAIGGALLAAFRRGGWYDEYATFYFADPAIPLRSAWTDIWPGESNPPFFYLIARFWLQIAGPTLVGRRLLNLVPLAFLLAWFIYAALRHPAHRPFLTCLALLAFSGKFFIWDFPEYRSYFWQYCAELVFLGSSSIAYLDRDRRIDIFQLVALPFLISFHQITTLYAGVLLIPLVLSDMRNRSYLRAASLVIVTVLALILLALFTAMQMHEWRDIQVHMSWIKPLAPLAAFYRILAHLADNMGHNWAAIIAACSIAFPPSGRPSAATASLIRLIAGAGFVATIIVLIVNAHAPLVVGRYFTFLTVELTIIIALTIAPVVFVRPMLAALVLANAGIYLLGSCVTLAYDRRWLGDADVVAQLVSQCPGTRIHAGSRPQDSVEQEGLADIAAADRLDLQLAASAPLTSCPEIYWTESHAPNKAQIEQHQGDVASAANDSAGFGLDAAALARARAIKIRHGIVLMVAPPPR